jgi:hypothetical protein
VASEAIIVLMDDVLMADFRAWLARRGLQVRPLPDRIEGLHAFLVSPTDEAMGAFRSFQGES